MEDFLKFNKMITPIIIRILFWIGVSICVIGGIIVIVYGASTYYGGGGIVFLGLLLLLLGPLAVRVYCEILIVLFSINNTLTDLKNKM